MTRDDKIRFDQIDDRFGLSWRFVGGYFATAFYSGLMVAIVAILKLDWQGAIIVELRDLVSSAIGISLISVAMSAVILPFALAAWSPTFWISRRAGSSRLNAARFAAAAIVAVTWVFVGEHLVPQTDALLQMLIVFICGQIIVGQLYRSHFSAGAGS